MEPAVSHSNTEADTEAVAEHINTPSSPTSGIHAAADSSQAVATTKAKKSFLPIDFGRVDPLIFRSAYPAKKTWSFVSTLGLMSMVCLSPTDVKEDLRDFCRTNKILLKEFDVGHNQDPFVVMSARTVEDIIDFIQGTNNNRSNCSNYNDCNDCNDRSCYSCDTFTSS